MEPFGDLREKNEEKEEEKERKSERGLTLEECQR